MGVDSYPPAIHKAVRFPEILGAVSALDLNNTKAKKLNEELVNNILTTTKEEKTMKRNRKSFVALLTACILMMCALAGCEGSTSQPAPTTTQTVAQPTETQVVQPTEAPTEAPSEPTVQPTETVVEHEPIMCDGIDFYEYYTHEKNIGEFINEMNYDTARIIVMQSHNVSAILKSGDSIEWNPKTYVAFHIYAPKRIKSIDPLNDNYFISWGISNDDEIASKGMAYTYNMHYDFGTENLEIKYSFNYEDGTSEEFVFYVTIDSSVEIPEELVVEKTQDISKPTDATVNSGENVIDGIDFTKYNNHEKPMTVCLKSQNVKFDKLSAVVAGIVDGKDKVLTILKEQDTFEGTVDMNVILYFFGTMEIKDITCTGCDDFFVMVDDITGDVYIENRKGVSCSNREITCEVTYEDGTKESITFYLTLE